MTSIESAAAVVETHVSVVVFIGQRAYKVYKPLRLPFVDQSTAPKRFDLAWREVALNRRLAPDVYLGVLDVLRDGEAIDHLIEMVRMPPDRRLSTIVASGSGEEEVQAVARKIAVFHEAASADSTEVGAAASPEAITGLWESSFAELEERRGDPLPADSLEAVTALARGYLAGRTALFRDRVRNGWARDGHGDLLADDIFCLDDGPRILDCLAFDDHLRHGDVLLDVAFLAMDLERLGRPELARRFLDAYDEFTAERHPGSLAHHYVAYRALVRCKVACLRATQDPGGPAADEARRLLSLCREHLEAARVRLVLVGGAPGVGKSTLARELSARKGWVVLSSDELRKDLAGLGRTERRHEDLDEGIYSEQMSEVVYAELVRRAGELLAMGETVILDASWATAAQRALAEAAAKKHAADLVAIECHAPPEVCHDRLVRRAEAGTDPSDATAALAPELAARRETWLAAAHVDTGGPLEGSLAAAEAMTGPA